MLALAGMWMYDLHLYTVAYVTRDPVGDLFAMRGAFLAGLVPLFALATKRNAQLEGADCRAPRPSSRSRSWRSSLI